MNELINQLDILQSKTIGLFKQYNSFELVINNQNSLLTTITLGELGGLNTSYTPSNEGQFKLFPNNLTLLEFKSDPFALYEFCKSFN